MEPVSKGGSVGIWLNIFLPYYDVENQTKIMPTLRLSYEKIPKLRDKKLPQKLTIYDKKMIFFTIQI